MSTEPKKPYRPRRLFPRSVAEIVTQATKPLMDQRGKLYGALLRDWAVIVGDGRAAVTKPDRLQFTGKDEAVLHLLVKPSAAPEMAYVEQQILEQCARYFGYRAINRLVLHATHGQFTSAVEPEPAPPAAKPKPVVAALPDDVPSEMRDVLTRLANHVASTVVKKD